MFDWNDEELTNILWDATGENDDHIVPYPDQTDEKPSILIGDNNNKKEVKQDTANSNEPKKTTVKSEHGVELGSSSRNDIPSPGRGFDLSSWPDGFDDTSSIAAKVDRDTMGAAMSIDETMSSKNDETTKFNNDFELFQNQGEETAGGNFVEYDWASIGSFDDLDRIFSNDGPIFGDMGVDNPDELWTTSSKDLTSSPLTLTTFIHDNLDESSSHAPRDLQDVEMSERIQACPKKLEDITATTTNKSGDKGKKTTNKKCEIPWSSCGSSFQQVNDQYPLPMVSPCPQLFSSGQLLASPLYGNMANYYHAPPNLAQFQSGEGNREFYEVPPGSVNANSLKKSFKAEPKLSVMSPKEKIEKLRRRQQMRAICAIQRQQQQFSNQVSVNESRGSFPSLDSNSPMEQDDSNRNSVALDNFSVEESVLYRLQETISKMDPRISLCIRNSLFRLAKSAMRRQSPNDTSSTNTRSGDEVLSNKDINNRKRFTGLPDIETDTNPIDRTVAHLLFHRPLEFSAKPAETPDSPLSANLLHEQKGNLLKPSENVYLAESLENSQLTSPEGSNTHGRFSGSSNIMGVDTSENAPNNENADERCKMVEASTIDKLDS